jgi:general secretion pathway protein D
MSNVSGAAALSLAAVFGLGIQPARGQTATLSVDPIAQMISAGSVLTVDVSISNASDLYAYQFDLTFNPSVLRAVSSSEGAFLPAGGSTIFISGTDDNMSGIVSATADTLQTAISGVSGSGELAVFTFDAIAPGTSAIGIQNETLLDSNLNIIGDTTTGGSVTISPSTTAAPEIDPATAMSAFALLLGGLAILRATRWF